MLFGQALVHGHEHIEDAFHCVEEIAVGGQVNRWVNRDQAASLRGAVLAAGFTATPSRVVRISHFAFEQNPYGWLQSAFNRAGGRWQALYYQIRAHGSAHALPQRPLVIAAGTALMPASVAVATVASLAGAGGAIEVRAEPV